jgi:chromosomal replication initiator protein
MIIRARNISIAEIQDAVARAFRLSRSELLSRNRRRHVACARHVAMYLSRELAGRKSTPNSPPPAHEASASCLVTRSRTSYPRIGIAFYRNHSSVIHACQSVERRRRLDHVFARLIEGLERDVCVGPTPLSTTLQEVS